MSKNEGYNLTEIALQAQNLYNQLDFDSTLSLLDKIQSHMVRKCSI